MEAARERLAQTDPELFALLCGEEDRQRGGIELIPSENYTDPEVLAALGSVFTNKYSEGYPGRRYYGGQTFTDGVEELARERARVLFRCEHANVQPLSGSPMNQAVYFAFLEPGDTVLAMDLSHGGHLTHGSPVSHMGRIFHFARYKTRTDGGDREDGDRAGRPDMYAVRALAREVRPKIVLCGTTSCPREDDYVGFRSVADEVGAIAMADISHVGGLVAAGVMNNPFDAGFDVVTTTTHKSLRGPRGGMILSRREFASRIDRSVFPGLQGGPHMNAVAALAVALAKASGEPFRAYAGQVLRNAQALAEALLAADTTLVSGGTDNHMLVVDTEKSFAMDGRRAERILDDVGITTNKQLVPDDPNPPLRPSGIRMGTPAATTRGMKEGEMQRLAGWMVEALHHPPLGAALQRLRGDIEELCRAFPVPGL